MQSLTIHLLPPATPAELSQSTAVVIDVLRATTTVVTALQHGAACVMPVAELDAARAMARRLQGRDVLLGGERGGEPIDGFDLGNSPGQYAGRSVAGKRIVFTTSHGTQAIEACRHASRVFIASFANLNAVVRTLAQTEGPVHLVCAGTDRRPSLEDSLCAAVIAGRLRECHALPTWTDDTTQMHLELYRARHWSDEAERARLLRAGRGGQRLIELGCAADIAWAAEMDTSTLVPELDQHTEPPRLVPATD